MLIEQWWIQDLGREGGREGGRFQSLAMPILKISEFLGMMLSEVFLHWRSRARTVSWNF